MTSVTVWLVVMNFPWCCRNDGSAIHCCPTEDCPSSLSAKSPLDAGGQIVLIFLNILHKHMRACAELPYAAYYGICIFTMCFQWGRAARTPLTYCTHFLKRILSLCSGPNHILLCWGSRLFLSWYGRSGKELGHWQLLRKVRVRVLIFSEIRYRINHNQNEITKADLPTLGKKIEYHTAAYLVVVRSQSFIDTVLNSFFHKQYFHNCPPWEYEVK